MSGFLNPQWLQSWHLSKVQQKPHSLIISWAVRAPRKLQIQSEWDGQNLNFLPFLRESNFTTTFFFIFLFLFSSCAGWNPADSPRTSAADIPSALPLPPLLNHGSNTLQMNKHLHPLSVKARRLLHSWIQERKKWRIDEGAQEKDDRWKGGSMPNWTNSKVTKPWHDFLVLLINRLIYFPLDVIITVLLIIFPP